MNINFLLCLCGIIINATGIAFNVYALNTVGAIVLLIGCIRMDFANTPLGKKIFHYAIANVIGSTGALFLFLFLNGSHNRMVSSIALGINVFFFIYFTYYFTEFIIDRAKQMNESAITRNFRSIWTMAGVLSFIYFMSYYNLTTSVVTIIAIVFLGAALYYCYATSNIGSVVFSAQQ